MVDFIVRLAAHTRKANPGFLVVLQNAEELTRHKRMLETVDAVAKEDLFYGADHSQNANSAADVRDSLQYLKAVKVAGRPVFVVDYVNSAAKKADARRRIEEQGFIPYIGPRDLGRLWLPGRDF
jgi:cysteinyl-tRNA synthetase